MDHRTCIAVTKTGKTCSSKPMQGEEYCFIHHPDKVKERFEARSRGGKMRQAPWSNKVLSDGDPALGLISVSKVPELIARIIDKVLTGELDYRLTGNIGYLISVYIRAVEVGELEDRITELEKHIELSKELQ